MAGQRNETDGLDVALVERLAVVYRGLRSYFRLQADGLEHVPKEGPALLVANHTGWLGLDYALAALVIHDERERYVRGMVHRAWFAAKATAQFAQRVGLHEVTKDEMVRQLQAGRLVMVFPEGEKGAFRPGSDYRLSEFARGFVRVAMTTQAPVVPVCIVGGEEANPVGRRLGGYQDLLGMGLPLPKNVVPKPVKWRIRFLPPRPFEGFSAQDAANAARVHKVTRDLQAQLQDGVDALRQDRGHPYL